MEHRDFVSYAMKKRCIGSPSSRRCETAFLCSGAEINPCAGRISIFEIYVHDRRYGPFACGSMTGIAERLRLCITIGDQYLSGI